jgi:predicted nucleic acid-binding Zn ribbon protein
MRRFQKQGLSAAIDVIEAGLLSANLAQALRPHMAKVYWEGVVGPQVSGATQVIAVRGGDTLVVRTKNSVWANELTLLKTDILSRLNRAIGGRVLTDIRFEIGPLNPKVEPPPDIPMPTPAELAAMALPLDVQQRIARSAGAIGDEDLRVRVHRGLTKAAQADEWKRSQGWTPCRRCGTLARPVEGREDHLCPVCRIDGSGVVRSVPRPSGNQ